MLKASLRLFFFSITPVGAACSDSSGSRGPSPDSEMQYNCCHDFQKSLWADYDINNLHMDEQTDGYVVAHNVLLNFPNIVHQNKNGTRWSSVRYTQYFTLVVRRPSAKTAAEMESRGWSPSCGF